MRWTPGTTVAVGLGSLALGVGAKVLYDRLTAKPEEPAKPSLPASTPAECPACPALPSGTGADNTVALAECSQNLHEARALLGASASIVARAASPSGLGEAINVFLQHMTEVTGEKVLPAKFPTFALPPTPPPAPSQPADLSPPLIGPVAPLAPPDSGIIRRALPTDTYSRTPATGSMG